MSDMPPPPPDDSGWSSEPPPPPPGEDASTNPQAAKGWASLGTGEAIELSHPATRLGARVVDVVIIVVVFIILLIIDVGSAIGLVGEPSDYAKLADRDLAIVAYAAIATALFGIVYEVALTAIRGQTLGKMATRIKVVRADNGLAPGWGKSIVRWIIPAVVGFIPVVGWILSLLVYASLLWDKARQGWHDKAVKTLVVKA